MRYWGILLAKLAIAGAILYAIWFGLYSWYTPPEHLKRFGHSPFMHDLKWPTLMFVYNLLVQGVLFLIIWDQRYRCRTCLRKLRMPVETGSWGSMLRLGTPRIEYICPYGHGTLNVEEVQISGSVTPEWTEHGDIWEELFAGKESDREF